MNKISLLDRRGFVLGAATSLLPVAGRADVSKDDFIHFVAKSREPAGKTDPEAARRALSYTDQNTYPILRVRQDEEVKVRLTNGLDQPTSLHWRGLRLPNAMDGTAGLTQKPIAPGETFDYRFKAADSGTFCFHPLVSGVTSSQIDKGLKGLLIVEELMRPDIDAEVILIVDQSERGSSLTVKDPTSAGSGTQHRPGSRLRLRIANLSSQNIMIAGFTGTKPLLIAIDGRPSALFEPVRQSLPMGPGARFDVMLDMPRQDGGKVTFALQHDEGPDGSSAAATTENHWIVEWTARGAPVPERPPIAKLPDNPALPPAIALDNALKFEFAVSKDKLWTLNGASWNGTLGKPLFSVAPGRPVSIGFANRSDEAVDLALHGHHCRLLHPMDDGWEPYWRDSILIPPRQTQHVAFVAGDPGKWMIHDAMTPHFDNGLAGWFEVT